MTISIICPSCSAKLRAPASTTGKRMKCPRCQTSIAVTPEPQTDTDFNQQEPRQARKPRSRNWILIAAIAGTGFSLLVLTGVLLSGCWADRSNEKGSGNGSDKASSSNPRGHYRAKWLSLHETRKLDEDIRFDGKPPEHRLRLIVSITTEPGVPTREVYGRIAFMKDREVLYETDLAEKSGVSFVDSCVVFVILKPYDDRNPKHRALRFASIEELTPHFTVKKVVYADGKEKTFD